MRFRSTVGAGRRAGPGAASGRSGAWLPAALIFVAVLDPRQPAHAYLDPGTGSIILQLLLGGVAGGVVIAKLYWQRVTSFFKRDRKAPEAAPSQPRE